MQNTENSVADVIARVCLRYGVARVFGVPGGGSSLDLIEAFRALGVPFILARSETAAAIMAAADAESTGSIGVVIATQGPGLASATNGMATAHLERAPVLLLTDGWSARQAMFDTHQVIDQQALMRPLTRAMSRLESDDVEAELESMVVKMRTAPWGPGFIELTGENARRQVSVTGIATMPPAPLISPPSVRMRELLTAARKPVIVAGLETRTPEVALQLQALAKRWRCPVVPTYKAKGVLPDTSPYVVGLFTGGAVERECLCAADLIVLCGMDPVELIGRPWGYAAPVVEIALVRHPVHYVEMAAVLHGPLDASLAAVAGVRAESEWQLDDFKRLRSSVETRLAYEGDGSGLTPEQVVRAALKAAGLLDAAMTVDAGAHMFSAMAFWQTQRQGDTLISNGLSTMGYALPAGIARALRSPDRPVIAFTGDGGLMMCVGELSTAAQYNTWLCVVVFNDAALSLIDIKQQSRKLSRNGVSWPRPDFAAIARGFGLQAWSAETPQELREALAAALATRGPTLIDARVDPSGYLAQSKILRG
jgi:acetolactate synthase-1/2/3 large subunit